MPEVSFYILGSASAQERDIFACKLAEKAYRQGIYSFILTESEAHSKILDDLLWTFRPASFVPHQLSPADSQDILPQILISSDPVAFSGGLAIINLSKQALTKPDQFERILEVLYQDDNVLQAGRDRYRVYQQAGINPVTHKL